MIVYGELDGKIYAAYNAPSDASKAIKYEENNYFDNIIGATGVRVDGNRISAYDFSSQVKVSDVQEYTISGGEYGIYFKDGKYGAKNNEGFVIVDPIYDSANFMADRSDVMIGYESGIKYYIYVFSNERYSEDEW